MVARAQAEGRRVLDVCVLTFLIRGINERRVSGYAYAYEFALVRTGRYGRIPDPWSYET